MSPGPVIVLERCRLRPWRTADAETIAVHMNDRGVWRNLRNRVPHPYTLGDARTFLAEHVGVEPPLGLAIEIDGAAVGALGARRGSDVYWRTMELGFWLGRTYWGRGVMSEAVPAFADWVFDTYPDVCRLHAEVMSWNLASARVLEKAGFVREGTLRAAVTKEGRTIDKWWFGLVREDRIEA